MAGAVVAVCGGLVMLCVMALLWLFIRNVLARHDAASATGTRQSDPKDTSDWSGPMAAFVVKGYGLTLAVSYVHSYLGGPAAACLASAVLARSRDPGMLLLLGADASLADYVFLPGVLPCLCAPLLALHGFGAAWLAYLCAAFLWFNAPVPSTDGLAMATVVLWAVYAFAWGLGLFVPLQDVGVADALLLAGAVALLRLCPAGTEPVAALASLAWSPVARAATLDAVRASVAACTAAGWL